MQARRREHSQWFRARSWARPSWQAVNWKLNKILGVFLILPTRKTTNRSRAVAGTSENTCGTSPIWIAQHSRRFRTPSSWDLTRNNVSKANWKSKQVGSNTATIGYRWNLDWRTFQAGTSISQQQQHHSLKHPNAMWFYFKIYPPFPSLFLSLWKIAVSDAHQNRKHEEPSNFTWFPSRFQN